MDALAALSILLEGGGNGGEETKSGSGQRIPFRLDASTLDHWTRPHSGGRFATQLTVKLATATSGNPLVAACRLVYNGICRGRQLFTLHGDACQAFSCIHYRMRRLQCLPSRGDISNPYGGKNRKHLDRGVAEVHPGSKFGSETGGDHSSGQVSSPSDEWSTLLHLRAWNVVLATRVRFLATAGGEAVVGDCLIGA